MEINFSKNIDNLILEHWKIITYKEEEIWRTLVQFGSAYLCESGLSAVLVIKRG